jgi:hypothetical protein
MQHEDYRHMFKKDSRIIRTSTVVAFPGSLSPTPSTQENIEDGHDNPEPAYERDIQVYNASDSLCNPRTGAATNNYT